MIANFQKIQLFFFCAVWRCKVKTDLGCFVGDLVFDWFAWCDVLRPVGHSACWWWGFLYFCKNYHALKSKYWVIYECRDLLKQPEEDSTVETSTGEDIRSWQHSQFIIQHSIFVWLPATADSRSSACFETTRVVKEALINLCAVFLVSCWRRLQIISRTSLLFRRNFSFSLMCFPFWKDLCSFCQRRSWFTGCRSRRL